MTTYPLTVDNLMTQERVLHDEVLAAAARTGRDARDVLLDTCPDVYHGARVAEVLGGPGAADDFRARYTHDKLHYDPDHVYEYGHKLVRDMADGRIGTVEADWDGHQLIEFPGGTEVRRACDMQDVGPDPQVMARARHAHQAAQRAYQNAQACTDPDAAARWRETAEHAEQQAHELEAGSMDWLAHPDVVHGFNGPPTADNTTTATPEPVDQTTGDHSATNVGDQADEAGRWWITPEGIAAIEPESGHEHAAQVVTDHADTLAPSTVDTNADADVDGM
jgi:hypothetical protein